MKQTVLVTGADGMLGSNIVRELLLRNYKVRAFIQPGRSANTLDGLDIEFVAGDVLNIGDIEKAVDNCDYIIHAAASTSIWPARNRSVYDINLEGTMNVVWVASEKKIKRLVHISSACVFAAGDDVRPGNESGSFNGYKYGLDYINSKYDAQKVVMKAVHCGLDAIIVNPTFMIGAFDSSQGSNSLILALTRGKIFVNPPGGKNFICAKDAAIAICNALTMGRKGECYILGNQNLSYKQFFDLTAEVVNCKPPQVSLSPYLIKAFGLISNFIASVFNKRPLITNQAARMSCDQHFFNSEKAVRELNLPQSPITQGIEESYTWFKQKNLL
jgi:dihydroflavonol-4-reductase